MNHLHNRATLGGKLSAVLVAAGSSVGLGNLWGFPYKMGNNGGFAFLIVYLALVIFVGVVVMLAELSLGRKSGKGVIAAYETLGKKYKIIGWFGWISPVLILGFYCMLGGYCIKYAIANIGDLFNASWGVGDVASADFFNTFVADPVQAVGFTLIFAILTIVIVMGGVANGLERFSVIAMPALFVMLLITVIRSVTLPGAAEGLAFMFKPNFEVFKGWGWLKVLASAGGQLFFSLSLASSALIAYSSYLDKKENLEKNALIVPAADTTVAILCGLATLPAVFAAGLEPTQGPGMLFVTLQTVFQSMSGAGPIFGTIFYLLVFLAALTSSISMLEGSVSSFMDRRLEKGKSQGRTFLCLTIGGISTAGAVLVALDALGAAGLPHLFGFSTWLDTFDLFSEGILMPGGCLIMTIILGWIRPGYIDDEIKLSGSYRSKPFVEICLKFLAPVFLAFIVVVQMDGFFKLGLF